jgi:hypothetical protein
MDEETRRTGDLTGRETRRVGIVFITRMFITSCFPPFLPLASVLTPYSYLLRWRLLPCSFGIRFHFRLALHMIA